MGIVNEISALEELGRRGCVSAPRDPGLSIAKYCDIG